jgi:hypothetical protein
MGPPPPPEAFVNGGSMPGPGKSLEQAHSENLIKYRKLKAKYFELENVGQTSFFFFLLNSVSVDR